MSRWQFGSLYSESEKSLVTTFDLVITENHHIEIMQNMFKSHYQEQKKH